MHEMKKYPNLYALYRRRTRPISICFWISMVLFLLSFGGMCLGTDFPFGLFLLTFLICVLMFGILDMLPPAFASKALKPFSPEQLLAIDRAIPSAEALEGIVVTDEAIILNRFRLQLCPQDKVLWVHKIVTTTRYRGLIPVHTDTQLILACSDHRKYRCQIRNKSKALEFLQEELGKIRQDIFYGYDNSIARLFDRDLQQLIVLGQEKAERARAAAAGETIGQPEAAQDERRELPYLESLPEQKNKYKVDLQPGEKVVFAAKLSVFASDTGDFLGTDCKFTMTNRRIFIDNGSGLWTTDIAGDIVSWRHEANGSGLRREVYTAVFLNKEIAYGVARQKMHGYRLNFGKKDMDTFEDILCHIL